MINLLKFQFRNLYKQPFTYVCIVIPLLISFILACVNKLSLTGYITPMIKPGIGILEIIFICFFMCLDSDNYITKNIISRGYSRINLFLSKFIVVSIVIIISTILKSIFINFCTHDPDFESTLEVMLILILPQIALYITLSTLVNNNVVSVVLCFTIDLIIEIFLIILSFLIFIALLHNTYSANTLMEHFLSYWVTALDNIDNLSIVRLLSLGWTTLLTSISIFIANKRDIK